MLSVSRPRLRSLADCQSASRGGGAPPLLELNSSESPYY
jgi:hypothetical protein